MNMKFFSLSVTAIFIALLAACSVQPVINVPDKSESSVSSQVSVAEENLSYEVYEARMYPLLLSNVLLNCWEGDPVMADEASMITKLTVIDVSKSDDIVTVTAEIYGNIYIDPPSFRESIGYGTVGIIADEDLAFGKSVVQFRESADSYTAISCYYEKYPHPGLDYLKEQTQKLDSILSQSPKIDVTKYDRRLVDYLWQVVFAYRYVESPEDLTEYDLENIITAIDLPQSGGMNAYSNVDTFDPAFQMDASLLALMPNLEYVYCPYKLDDYSVFKNMYNLKKLTLCNIDDESIATLQVGHTDELVLFDPDVKMLDLTNVSTDLLRINSWYTSVGGFAGCENIKKLYFMSTRTDMRLVNAETFPNLDYLNLYFYSDTPRVRDFSGLKSFEKTKIDISLDYQACNNETVESLIGIKLNDVYLVPDLGTYPLPDFDASLAEELDAESISFESDLYFMERTGD